MIRFEVAGVAVPQARAKATNRPPARKWTSEEIEFLKENYPSKGKNFCCLALNRRDGQVRQKACDLKLRQDESSEFFKEWQRRAAITKIGKKRPDQSIVIKALHAAGKLVRTSESNRKIGERIKERIRVRGHPKGFMGHKHSESVKSAQSERSLRTWADKECRLNSKEYRQEVSDRMTQRVSNDPRMRTGYSRGKMGTREDLGIYVRSSWEANYARYLNTLITSGEILSWEYEPERFVFEKIKRGCRSYLPDFKITDVDGSIRYVEVKGYLDQKGKTRIKRMKKYYPKIRLDVVDKDEYKKIQKLKLSIPNWE